MLKRILLITTLASTSLLIAKEEPPFSYWDIHPIHVGGNAIRLGSADVTETPKKGHLIFGKYNAFLDVLVPITKKSYFFPRVDWTTFTLDWNKNPKFNTTQFNYTQFSLSFFTTDLENWRWIIRAQYNLDNKHFNNPSQYGLFSGLLWGATEFNEKWHYHVGALGYKGMEGGQYWPVIGFDYSPNKKWTFFAVFPIEYYIRYNIDKHWHASLKVRPLKERFRVGENEPQPKSVFSYTSIGTEVNIHYEIFRRLDIEAYGGWNFGGDFYIKDQHGQHPLYTNTGGSAYGGASLNWGI